MICGCRHNTLCIHVGFMVVKMAVDQVSSEYSYSTTNKMHLLSQIIYSCKTLYMFRTVFPSIIRSAKLRIQQRYMSNSCCYLLLAAASFCVSCKINARVKLAKTGHGPHSSILVVICVVLLFYNDAPQSVGLLWTSDQLVAETST